MCDMNKDNADLPVLEEFALYAKGDVIKLFPCSTQQSIKCILPIYGDVKMPTVVRISTKIIYRL